MVGRIVAMTAADVNSGFKQPDSGGQSCSNKSFMTVDDISVMCCNLCCHLLTWISSKVKIFLYLLCVNGNKHVQTWLKSWSILGVRWAKLIVYPLVASFVECKCIYVVDLALGQHLSSFPPLIIIMYANPLSHISRDAELGRSVSGRY